MLTDEEIDSLAREIFTKVIDRISDWDEPPFEEVWEAEDGELIPIYGATSTEGYGDFVFEYMPLAVVKKIIVGCERIFNDFTITLSDAQSGASITKKISEVHPPETHKDSIYTLAHCSVYYLIASFRDRLCDLMEEGAKDCEVIAETLLASGVGEQVKRAEAGKITADVRADIEKAAGRVAES